MSKRGSQYFLRGIAGKINSPTMRTLAIFVLGNICFGQCPAPQRNSTDQILGALDAARQRRNEAARVQVEATRVQVEAAHANADIEKLRAETSLLHQQSQLLTPPAAPTTVAATSLGETNDWKPVIERLSFRYPDIARYREEMGARHRNGD